MSQPECYLVQCREQIMEEEVALTMFETDKYGSAVKQGQIVTVQSFLTLLHLQLCCSNVSLILFPGPYELLVLVGLLLLLIVGLEAWSLSSLLWV